MVVTAVRDVCAVLTDVKVLFVVLPVAGNALVGRVVRRLIVQPRIERTEFIAQLGGLLIDVRVEGLLRHLGLEQAQLRLHVIRRP